MPYQANSVAAGGANASAFGPTAASTLPVFCFFSYGFLANGQDLEMASPSPELPRLTFYFAGRIKSVVLIRFPEGYLIRGQRIWTGCR